MPSRLLAELVSLVAPPSCAACATPLLAGDERICSECRRAMSWLRGPCCRRCGLPSPCGRRCPAAGAAFESAWSPLAYDGAARELVQALKFRGALPVAHLMAAAIAANAPPGLLEGATLVPVPLHPSRRRARGFNQAERLARALAPRMGLPVHCCLHRHGPATRQVGAGRTERRNRARLDVVVRGEPPHGAVLIDDVHTTGATFEACAAALRDAGAARVVAIAYARTL